MTREPSVKRVPVYFFLITVLCQVVAIGLGILTFELSGSFPTAIVIMACCAFGLSRWLKLPAPWQALNLLMIPAVVIWSLLDVPAMASGTVLFAIALLFMPTFWTRVPYFPTHRKMYDAILSKLPQTGGFSFVDIGCGGGTLLAYLARRRPDGSFLGVDISPMAWFLSHLRTFTLGKVRVRFKSLWALNFGDFDVVYAFLAPGPMPDVWEKAKREMKTGSLFISNTFEVPDEATEVITIDDSRQGRLYCHVMKGPP